MKCRDCEKLRRILIHTLMVNYMQTEFGLGKFSSIIVVWLVRNCILNSSKGYLILPIAVLSVALVLLYSNHSTIHPFSIVRGFMATQMTLNG